MRQQEITADSGVGIQSGDGCDRAAEASPDLPSSPTTVLVVDDERAICRLAEKILARAGYTVVTHESADSALAWWRDHRAQVLLVVTDALMPGATGPEMLAAMRQEQPDLAAILMSGYVGTIDAGAMLGAGDLYLPKPFTAEEFRRAIGERVRAARRGGT